MLKPITFQRVSRAVCLLGLTATALAGSSCTSEATRLDPTDQPSVEAVASLLRACDLGGAASGQAVIRGAIGFLDRRSRELGGNGRACADCHMPSDGFQLSPASAEARFQALQSRRKHHPEADDPLFRPIDADDFRINGHAAEDYTNLRQNGLIRITFPLPPTLSLVDPVTGLASAERFVDVWRAVPTVNNVKLTGPDPDPPSWPCAEGGPPGPPCVPRGPNPNGGYQIDARIGNLQDQALAALTNHAQVQRPPSPGLLDDLATFESVLFSSRRLRAISQALDRGIVSPPDPDPRLTALEREGKTIFLRACAQCHGEAAGTHPLPGIHRFGDIFTACPRPVDGPQFPGYTGSARFEFAPCKSSLARNVRLYEIRLPDGTVTLRPSSDPGRSLLTGIFAGGGPGDDWQALDVPSIRGISQTAPYFHNNSAATLDEVLDHYAEMFKFVAAVAPAVDPAGAPIPRPPVISTDGVHLDRPFTREERPALLAYLRRL